MDKLERKLGKYAIPNLTLALILGYALGYIISFVDIFRESDFLSYLYLDPYKIIHGEVWRIFTWLIVPPQGASTRFTDILFIFLMMWCCLSIGMVLERTWGTFRFNVYIFGGVFLTVVSSFAVLGILYLILGPDALSTYEDTGFIYWSAFSTYYINMSIYLGFAMTYPNNIVRFMFLIPVKMKWLGIIDLFYMGYAVVNGIMLGHAYSSQLGIDGRTISLPVVFAVCAALVNIVVFYLINIRKFSIKNRMRQAKYNHAYNAGAKRARKGNVYTGRFSGNGRGYENANSYAETVEKEDRGTPFMRNPGAAKHKCSICGQTEISNPSLEFRYCSKCVGNYEYCQQHLFTHTHKN